MKLKDDIFHRVNNVSTSAFGLGMPQALEQAMKVLQVVACCVLMLRGIVLS